MTTNNSNTNTIILLTGSNTGIGYATAQALLTAPLPSRPVTIILTSRTLDKAVKASQDLKDDQAFLDAWNGGCQVVPKQLDIDDEASVKALHKDLKEQFGRVDVLVNNAGAHYDFQVASGKMTTREAFIGSFTTNVVSTHLLTESFMDLLFSSDSPRLIFLSSGLSSLGDHSNPHVPVNHSPPAGWPKQPIFQTPTYRTSKTAMNMMILEWCRTLKNDNVKIHILDPGFLSTTLGGAQPDVLKEKGAKDPIEGGRFIRSIIEGERDGDQGKLIGSEGIIPW
ncbi:hypothetical protein I302_107959 [Kwoniella bestiolae CBS 10118]|uniref:Short-chain dehydrogenase n=1 Tax=Kwoniella bestiolae CBS 10118 TaxID=1296100 RepID=A0A1B9FX26_9TREE|nr:hypothetical protein I302_07677 [Kwoniella bestiolae CBS 10118]OCF23323.1 hypothetical protein I302_07677 [Kwoniella bestiolae CBS 10118]